VDNDKEALIKLVNEFVAVGEKAILLEDDSDDDCDLNDQLNVIALKIEEATVPVFGHKVNMDFGTINAIFHETEHVINEIKNYKKTD